MKTKNDLLKLNDALKQGNAKFKYGVKKNMLIIQDEIESIQSAKYGEQPTCDEIDQIRNEIYQKYGEVDPTNPNILVIPYFIKNEDGSTDNTKLNEKYIESQKEFNEKLDEIKDVIETFNKEIEAYNLEVENYNKMLNEDIDYDIDFFEINIDNVPDEFMEVDLLMDFSIIK